MDEFLSWLRDNGALFPKIVWPAETSLGRGAIALEDISANEIMVEIPFRLMMTPVHAMEDAEVGAIMRENEELLAGDLMLALYLMYEKEKGASSFYAPYISILPSPASIVNWSEEDLALFQDKSLLNAIKFRISDLNKMYMNIEYICEKHPSVFPREIHTFERFKWAYQVVQSRAFGRRLPWSALVPFSDCLNHSNIATKYDYDVDANKTFRLFPSGGSIGYLKGAEVFNSYGRRANDNLLLDYGFAMEDNEWDTVSITVCLPKSDEAFALKRKILHSFRLSTVMRHSLSRFNLPLNVMLFYRILAMSKDDMLPFENDDDEMVKSNFLALDLEIRALNLLITSMSSLLCQYATTLEEDEALLLSDGQNVGGESCKTMKTALIYRVTQKRILLKTSTKLKYLTTVLKSLDQNQEVILSLGDVVCKLGELSGGTGSRRNIFNSSLPDLQDYLKVWFR